MMTRRLSPVWIGLILAAFCGCDASDQGPTLVPVRGVLTYKGTPLAGAELTLHPLDDASPGWLPVAISDEAGRFEAGTRQPGDGAPAGRYRLTVVRFDEDDATRNLLPARYADPKTTDLEIEAGPGSEDLPTFDLTDRPSRNRP